MCLSSGMRVVVLMSAADKMKKKKKWNKNWLTFNFKFLDSSVYFFQYQHDQIVIKV